jgi:hypothetical protein
MLDEKYKFDCSSLALMLTRRRKKEEARGKKEEGRGKKEEGRRKREEGRVMKHGRDTAMPCPYS